MAQIEQTSSNQTTELLHPTRITPRQWLVLVLGMLASMIEGFDIVVISYTAPAISADWGVSAKDLGIVLSSGVLGMTIGAMFLSWMADRYGRRIMVSIALLVSGAATAAVMWSDSVSQLVVLRTLAGVALGILVASLAPLIGEFSPSKHRILIVSALVAAASAGAMIGGLATAKLIPAQGWQSVFWYAGLITLVLGVLIQWLVPESIAFTIKRHPETSLQRVNKTLATIGQTLVEKLPDISPEQAQESATVNSLLTAHRRKSTLLVWAAFFTGFVVVYFVSSWMPQVLSNAGLSHEKAIQGASAIPFGSLFGALAIGWLTRWVPLNRVVAAGFLLGTIIIAGMALMVNDIGSVSFIWVWSLLFLIGITLMGAFSNLYNVVLVIYPAQIRSTGLGWAAGLGRAGAVISPLLAGVLIGWGVPMPLLFVCFAIPGLLAAASVWVMQMRELT